MSKRTYVLLSLCGASILLTIISLIAGTDIYLTALMHGPIYSLGILAVLLIAAGFIACSNSFGITICIPLALLLWLAILTQRPAGVLHYGIVISVSLVVFLGMVWDDEAGISGRVRRSPFWRYPD